jgi:hypothetical protein
MATLDVVALVGLVSSSFLLLIVGELYLLEALNK